MDLPAQSEQVITAGSRWRTVGLVAVSAFVGFVGFFWGSQAVSHQCDLDFPVWKGGIMIFSAVASGYSFYKVPRWYFKMGVVAILFTLVSFAGRIYLYEVHK